MVSEIDADAPFRENKELHPLDAVKTIAKIKS